MRVYEKSLFARYLDTLRSDVPVNHAYEGQEVEKEGRSGTLPSYKLRGQEIDGTKKTFQVRRARKTQSDNPYEPMYYEKLPVWLRADGMYAPLEIGKLIFYLLIPIVALVALGSRNVDFVENIMEYTGEFMYKAQKTPYDEQLKLIKKIDEEGARTMYGDNIALPGSTKQKRDQEEGIRREMELSPPASATKDNSEYFVIMKHLRQEQKKDLQMRAEIGKEADSILEEGKEQGSFVIGKATQQMM